MPAAQGQNPPGRAQRAGTGHRYHTAASPRTALVPTTNSFWYYRAIAHGPYDEKRWYGNKRERTACFLQGTLKEGKAQSYPRCQGKRFGTRQTERMNPSPTDAAYSPNTTENRGFPYEIYLCLILTASFNTFGAQSCKKKKVKMTRATARVTKWLQNPVHSGFYILPKKPPTSNGGR